MSLSFINSKSDYFHQTKEVLIYNWSVFTVYLKIKGYSEVETKIYEKAYLYFIDHPDHFDGATMTEDLYDVFRLDLDAMLHDFYYINHKVSASYKYTQMADQLFFKETLRKNKSTWNAGARKFLLKLKSVLGFNLYVKYALKRIMTEEHKKSFISDYETLTK